MLIKEAAFGNTQEAFVENRLANSVNIIYSNDNNKGKTLLIQGIMFALGNTPIFQAGFDHENYYFYVKVEIGNKEYEFLRKRDSTIVKATEALHIFSSVSELKYYIDKYIFPLPRIYKNGEDKIVDPLLYYELFFIGQDKRNTSNVQNYGYYRKSDFEGMLRSLNGYPDASSSDLDIE